MRLDRVTIAILTEDDGVWALRAWERTIPRLKARGWRVAALWTCPPSAGWGARTTLAWYGRTFGLLPTAKLAAYALLVHARRYVGRCASKQPTSFASLCRQEQIPHCRCRNGNDPAFREWLTAETIDVLLIMVDHVLQEAVLQAPRLGAINKHAALLPANKGLFPYFWARLHGEPHGISFHKVVREIDAGPILAQERVDEPFTASMLRFYHHVFERYPELLLEAVDALAAGRRISPPADVTDSYHSRPTRDDHRRFAAGGGCIARWRDLVLAWTRP